MTGWIEDCITSHPACQNESKLSLPTRLLDVSSKSEPFLVHPGDLTARYVALTYCWGEWPQFFPPKTTCRNLNSRVHKLPISDLPVLFREAIEVTRRLGIQFIWIDALCIIQDTSNHDCTQHQQDWSREGTKMAEYYGNAFLTISPLSCRSSHQGIYRPRAPKQSFNLPMSKCEIGTRTHSWAQALGSSPLQNRAWTLQERLLSRRVLHFHEQELFWECETVSRRESQLGELRHEVTHSSTVDPIMSETTHFKRLAANLQAGNTTQVWAAITTNYSQRSLSNKTDKLIAISGIASYFKTNGKPPGNLTYMAGLWKEHIAGLLWKTLSDTYSDHEGVAPSWSWANAKNRISYDERIFGSQSSTSFNAECMAFFLPSSSSTPQESAFNILGQLPRGTTMALKAFTKSLVYIRKERVSGSLFLPDSSLEGPSNPFGTADLDGTLISAGEKASEIHVPCMAIWVLETVQPIGEEVLRRV